MNERKYSLVVNVLLLLTVVLPYGDFAFGEPRTETANFGHDVIALYRKGRVPEGRRALLALARSNLEGWRRIKKNRPIDIEARLGIYHIAWLIPKCLKLDMMHAKQKNIAPEVIAISEEVLSALDAALIIARKGPAPTAHLQGTIGSAEVAGARLVTDLARALKDTGEEARAQELAQRHVKFLNITVDTLLAQAPAKPLPYGHQVLKFYEAGRLKEARSALVQVVRREIEAGKKIRGNSRRDLEMRLGVSIVAHLIRSCLELETKAAGKGPLPAQVVAVANELTVAIDGALTYVAEQPEVTERVKALAAGTRQSKLYLVVSLTHSLLATGDRKSATAVANKHAAFLAKMGKPAEGLLDEALPAEPGAADSPQGGDSHDPWRAITIASWGCTVIAFVLALWTRRRRAASSSGARRRGWNGRRHGAEPWGACLFAFHVPTHQVWGVSAMHHGNPPRYAAGLFCIGQFRTICTRSEGPAGVVGCLGESDSLVVI